MAFTAKTVRLQKWSNATVSALVSTSIFFFFKHEVLKTERKKVNVDKK